MSKLKNAVRRARYAAQSDEMLKHQLTGNVLSQDERSGLIDELEARGWLYNAAHKWINRQGASP